MQHGARPLHGVFRREKCGGVVYKPAAQTGIGHQTNAGSREFFRCIRNQKVLTVFHVEAFRANRRRDDRTPEAEGFQDFDACSRASSERNHDNTGLRILGVTSGIIPSICTSGCVPERSRERV